MRAGRDPTVCGVRVSLHSLHQRVSAAGGADVVSAGRTWRRIAELLGIPVDVSNVSTKLRQAYQKYLAAYDLGRGHGTAEATAALTQQAQAGGGAGGGGGAEADPDVVVTRVTQGNGGGGSAAAAPPPQRLPLPLPPQAHAPPPPPPVPQLPPHAVLPPLVGLDRQSVRCGSAACARLLTIPVGSTRFKCGTCGTLQTVPQ